MTLLQKHFGGQLHVDDGSVVGPGWSSVELETACAALPSRVDAALHAADFRSATAHLVASVDIANQLLNAAEPWKEITSPAGDDSQPHRLLSKVARACRAIAAELAPFCPAGATILRGQLGEDERTKAPEPVFARLG